MSNHQKKIGSPVLGGSSASATSIERRYKLATRQAEGRGLVVAERGIALSADYILNSRVLSIGMFDEGGLELRIEERDIHQHSSARALILGSNLALYPEFEMPVFTHNRAQGDELGLLLGCGQRWRAALEDGRYLALHCASEEDEVALVVRLVASRSAASFAQSIKLPQAPVDGWLSDAAEPVTRELIDELRRAELSSNFAEAAIIGVMDSASLSSALRAQRWLADASDAELSSIISYVLERVEILGERYHCLFDLDSELSSDFDSDLRALCLEWIAVSAMVQLLPLNERAFALERLAEVEQLASGLAFAIGDELFWDDPIFYRSVEVFGPSPFNGFDPDEIEELSGEEGDE